MNRPTRNRSLRRLTIKDYTIGKVRTRWLLKVDLTGIAGTHFEAYVIANSIGNSGLVYTGSLATQIEYSGPQNWSTMIYPFWGRACIMANKTRWTLIQISNNSGANAGAVWKHVAYPATAPINYAGASQYDFAIQQNYNKRRITWNTAPNNKSSLASYITTKKMYGFNTNKVYLDDSYQVVTSTNGSNAPTRQWYQNWAASTIGDVAAVNFFYLEVVSHFYFRAWEQQLQVAA